MRRFETRGKIVQLGKLILRERLGGEQVQRAHIWIVQHRIQDRQVVAKGLPGRRRRYDDNIALPANCFRSHRLVAVQTGGALCGVRSCQLCANPFRHGRELCFPCRDVVQGSDNFAKLIALRELLDDFSNARQRDRVFRLPHRQ